MATPPDRDPTPPDHPAVPGEAVDQDQPIPGSRRSRVALVFGLLILLAIVVLIAWFIISYNEKPEPAGPFG